jgi:hypothetical protein
MKRVALIVAPAYASLPLAAFAQKSPQPVSGLANPAFDIPDTVHGTKTTNKWRGKSTKHRTAMSHSQRRTTRVHP